MAAEVAATPAVAGVEEAAAAAAVAAGGAVAATASSRLKTIAVDLDDTLNNFSEVLHSGEFANDPADALSEEKFRTYLDRVLRDADEDTDLLSTEFTYFRARLHLRCFARTVPQRDAVEFMRGLRRDGWRIVICTRRDLRRAHAYTHRWLTEQGIPFDYLFTAGNKIAFCALWKIPFLVDDDLFSIEHGRRFGVQVFYPAMAKHAGIDPRGAKGFAAFAEVRPWIGA